LSDRRRFRLRLLLAAAAICVGLGLLANWWLGELTRDDAKGLFMMGAIALLLGADRLAACFGFRLLGRDGRVGTDTTLFDSSDGGCDGGGDGD
jgi:hypothetical protein